jgi:hypothetical protein
MRRLVLTVAVASALVTSALGATTVWSDAAQPAADDYSILWGT